MADETFSPGHVFFRPGDPAERAYLLTDGQVELLAGPSDGSRRCVLFGPGDVFGEMALVEERPRAFTARAVTAGRAAPMTRGEFERLLTNDPVQIRHYLRSLFERLRSLSADQVACLPPTSPPPAGPVTTGRALALVPPAELPGGPGEESTWAAVLHPLTRKAAETLPDQGLRVARFPFRIGRASGVYEREAFDLNDLWLLDNAPYNVSRNHCELVASREGLVVRDRGSNLGCVVNETVIGGGAATGYARLETGDNVLVVGSRMSPYQFRITVSPA